ncbi:MAG: hypothetical protein B6I38_00015 [Anaerolineaceae bacterium 4572_5.1]|nr:MAG: hypothetical protein B6I38_00015 [Anaerolineaceae bacterium 4572_5.1]
MSKPLSLFINPEDDWHLEYGFGWSEESDEDSMTFDIHDHTLLSTAGDGLIYAAAPGELSVKLPSTEGLDPIEEPLDSSITLDPDEDTIDITLHLSLNQALASDFRARSSEIHTVTGFGYQNIESSDLIRVVEAYYKDGTLPPNQLSQEQVIAQFIQGELRIPVETGVLLGKASTRGAPSGSRYLKFAVLTENGSIDPAYIYEYMRDFVTNGQSEVDELLKLIPVSWPLMDPLLDKSEAIEKTVNSIFPFTVLHEFRNAFDLSDEEWRTVGDNQKALYIHRLRDRYGYPTPGRTDPPFEFNDLDRKNIFQLEAIVEFFANFDDPWKLGAKPQEKVDPFKGNSAVVDEYWITLDGNHDLSQVKNNHHFIYLSADTKRPTRKYRIVKVEPTERRVMVDEAPSVNNGKWSIEIHKSVNFLPMSGTEARVEGKIVALDGDHDLTRVKPNRGKLLYDTIHLENVTGKKKLYRIKGINPDEQKIELYKKPQLSSDETTSWHINHRPILVIIDPFGPRYHLRGISASVSSDDSSLVVLAPRTSKRALKKELKRVNTFDTVYFPADMSGGRRMYRITEKHTDQLTIRVDGQPIFEGGTSAYDIQAGIGGNLDALHYENDDIENWPYEASRANHWDGALFVVYNGEVLAWYRWNSFTSRRKRKDEYDERNSSIRGNREYDFYSFYSQKQSTFIEVRNEKFQEPYPDCPDPDSEKKTVPRINYCIKVADALATYDGVREARFYFADKVTEDTVDTTPPGQEPGPKNRYDPNLKGKTRIRLHWSHRRVMFSIGCLVSPFFRPLVDRLIKIYQDEHKAKYGKTDSDIAKLFRKNHKEAMELHCRDELTVDKWRNKIAGTLWVIRPDERPLS